MSRNDTKITIYGTKVASTARAVRFIVRAIGETPLEPALTEWFPLSQVTKIVTDPSEVGRDYLVVSEWIMKEKGLLNKIVKADPRHAPPESDDDDWDEEDHGIF